LNIKGANIKQGGVSVVFAYQKNQLLNTMLGDNRARKKLDYGGIYEACAW